jgi:citrate/tricarballylate utilization protein
MYAPPHEFAINPPAILSAVRRDTYDRYLPRLPAGRRATVAVTALGALAVLAAAVLAGAVLAGPGLGGGTSAAVPGSPYRVIGYPALLAAAGLALAWGLAMTGWAARRYWRDTGGRVTLAGLAAAAGQAVTLRNLRGGGADCSYPGDEPSPWRRRLHHLVAGGFGLCAASTVAAAVSQDILGDPPPYPVLSVPVLLGVLGGAGLAAGGGGLLLLRSRSDPSRTDGLMSSRTRSLLLALLVLSVTGLLTLLLRGTVAFAPVLVIHLAAVTACFAIAPYTKFVHVIFRFLALVHDRSQAGRAD